MPAESGQTEAANFMRESAEQLRRIANLQFFLAPQLLKMAQGLDDRAGHLDAEAPEAP
jgi:hypothetical protein